MELCQPPQLGCIDSFTKGHLLNELINQSIIDKAVCRTSPATLGLLMIVGKGGRGIILEKYLSVLLTVLALPWQVAAENVTSKDHLTSHTLNKLLGLQRTLLSTSTEIE